MRASGVGRDPATETAVDVRVHRSGRAVVLSVLGEVDMLNAPTLAGHMNDVQADASVVVVDLSLVAFFSSTAIAALIDSQQRLAERGISLRVVPSAVVRRTLQLTGLDNAIPLYDRMASALAAD